METCLSKAFEHFIIMRLGLKNDTCRFTFIFPGIVPYTVHDDNYGRGLTAVHSDAIVKNA